MGLLDDLRKELTRVFEREIMAAERQKANAAPPAGPPASEQTGTRSSGTGDLPLPPAKRLAVVTCMDTRVLVEKALNLRAGDAHILRNAGGLVTGDMLRSLAVSVHLLEVNQIIIIGHTGCGMMTFQDDELRARIRQKMGASVPVPEIGAFGDVETNVREQIRRVRTCPWIPSAVDVRGFVYDLKTGRLNEVSSEGDETRQAAPPQRKAGTASATAAGQGAGRLQRERMERGTVAPGAPAMPDREDFRRKVTAMALGEPEALGALTAASPFDLGLTDTPAPDSPPALAALTLSPREMLRSLVLGEALDEPKGRRSKRPHPK